MNFVQSVLDAVEGFIKQNPALAAGLLNVAVVLAAKLGLHLSAANLAEVAGVVAALLAAWTHQATRVKVPAGDHEKPAAG